MRYPAILAALIVLAPPQESDKAHEDLVRELEDKFERQGAVSAELTLETLDPTGKKTLKDRIQIHVNPPKQWLYCIFHNQDPSRSKEATHLLCDREDEVTSWVAGAEGEVVDWRRFWTAFWRMLYELEKDLCVTLGEAERYPRFDAFMAALRPLLDIDLQPEASGKVESKFRLAVGRGDGSHKTSWMKQLRMAPQSCIRQDNDIVTIRNADKGVTIVIDRKTGFLSSIRNDFASGESRLVTAMNLKPETSKPETRLPARIKKRRLPFQAVSSKLEQDLFMAQAPCLKRILNAWDKVAATGREGKLEEYFTRLAARRDALDWEAARRFWAATYVKHMQDQGVELDDLASDPDQVREQLEEYLEQGEELHGKVMSEAADRFRAHVLAQAKEAPGSDEIRRQLVARIKEGFDPKRVNKERTKLPKPNINVLLRDAIEEVRKSD